MNKNQLREFVLFKEYSGSGILEIYDIIIITIFGRLKRERK